MDGLTLAASVVELQCLVGGKIEKIQQPEKYELLFSVHTNSGSKRLLVSSSSENCRIQLTSDKRLSPAEAPNFLMLLRKHLTGARIVSIEQPNLDRIVLIRFEAFTELHASTSFTLACEIMGRYSNIILVDESGSIVDSIRRVSAGMSTVRLVLPKIRYEFPPLQDKRCILDLSADDLRLVFESSFARPEKALAGSVFGLAPNVASILIQTLENGLEASFVHVDAASLADAVMAFYDDLMHSRTEPSIVRVGEKSLLLPFTPSGSAAESFPSVSEASDEFYRMRAQQESVHKRTASLDKVLSNAIQRIERKAEKFALSIGDEAEIERLRLCGELLTAHMYSIKSGSREAAVQNYYLDPPETVVIPLDETLSVSDNAQQYYKKYRKAKSAREIATVKHEEAANELAYLRGINEDLASCLTDADFEEIRQELEASGYVRSSQKKRIKLPASKPHHFVSSDGIDIYVGKNNIQNDRLTFRESSSDDIWLHTKDIHGSHVIIRAFGAEVPDSTLLEAAILAALHSQAKDAPSVPVDYTKRKYVKKPNGAKPGMVIYTNQKTLIVNPDPLLADKLRK